LEKVLRQAKHSSFLLIDHTDESAKRILVFAGEDCEYLLRNRTLFLDVTFNNCPRQFMQLCSLRVDLGSTSDENYVFHGMFALLTDEEGTIYYYLLTLLKSWCSRPPKIINVIK
jgi:hypothetical protein